MACEEEELPVVVAAVEIAVSELAAKPVPEAEVDWREDGLRGIPDEGALMACLRSVPNELI